MAKTPKADPKSVMLAPNQMIPFTDPRIPYSEGVVASYKMDGNRLFVRAGSLLTRSMLPQRNKALPAYLRTLVEYAAKHDLCFDGELLLPRASHHGEHGSVFNSYDAAIPDGTVFHVFDCLTLAEWEGIDKVAPFHQRATRYRQIVIDGGLGKKSGGRVEGVEQFEVSGPEHAERSFSKAIGKGYEGIMLRNQSGGYKQGRCGHKGAWLLKFKAEDTIDGVIVEVIQMRKMKDGIDRTRNAWGRLERPTVNDDNYTVQDAVGAVRVRTEDGVESEVMFAAGFADMEERRRLWQSRRSLIGRWVEIKHYAVGAKDGIRSGRIIRWRDDKAGAPVPGKA